jgi:hypothetical protein
MQTLTVFLIILQLRNSSVEVVRGAYFFGALNVYERNMEYRYDVGWSKDGRLTALKPYRTGA